MSPKPVEWIASALNTLRTFPGDVQRELGFALYLVQIGETPQNAKPLHGPLRDVFEISESDPSGTYRLIYTRRGIATPKSELDLIAQRLRDARRDHEHHPRG